MLPSYRLEPIIHLDKQQIAWAELLFGATPGPSLPNSVVEWRKWYQMLPLLVEEALSESSFEMVAVNVDTVHLLDSTIRDSFGKLASYPVMVEWTERRDQQVGRIEVDEAGDYLVSIARDCGFKIALDDMGAGEDAMTRLVALLRNGNPDVIDVIKIDGPFFQACRSCEHVEQVLRLYIAMFSELGISTCIEWIETPNDLELAQRLGACWGQGYYWRPEPLGQLLLETRCAHG